MKIKFAFGCEYDIYYAHWLLDEGGTPIDIILYGKEDTLLEIAEYFCLGGFNCQEVDPIDAYQKELDTTIDGEPLFEGLYGRLELFEIIEFSGGCVTYVD